MTLATLTIYAARAAHAQESSAPRWLPTIVGWQVTLIGQYLPAFASRYSGPNSLIATGDQAASHTYGLYVASRLASTLGAYVDLEMAKGVGISRVTGLGGYANGDVIRQGTSDLGTGPYVARAFLRYALRLSPDSERVERAQDQLPGFVPDRRLEITVGKLAASDLFDQNRYANSSRLQFLNWSLFQNTAWDFAADTRGYTNGIVVSYVTPGWSVRLGSFQMPTKANGNTFDGAIGRARGDNLELTARPDERGTTIRLLGYVNHARMGDYQEALIRAVAHGTVPDVAADDQPGRVKYGVGLNVEVPLADSGETGLFARAGWNDGQTESFAFTEVDRHLSVGAQVTGAAWGRTADRVGVAVAANGLSNAHRTYLAAGGQGFQLGDGALDYGLEGIAELYYRLQIGRFLQVGPDFQFVVHPGYNRARGPAAVLGLRVNARY